MALSPQTSRALRLITVAASTATAFHCVFRTDYGDEEHVFSDLQSWYRNSIDKALGIDGGAVEAERRKRKDALRDSVQESARRWGDEGDDRPGGRGKKHGGRSLTEEVVARER